MRGFEIIKKSLIDQTVAIDAIKLPSRSTLKSAGYDFCSGKTVTVAPKSQVIIPTFIKAYMPDDEFLAIYIRSSLAIKRHLHLANHVAIIDSDYYNNPDNDGHIMLAIINQGDEEQVISFGEKIAQGIFQKYYLTIDDQPGSSRTGGIGSTGK